VDCNDEILVLYAYVIAYVYILESTKVPLHYFGHVKMSILKFNGNDLNNFKYGNIENSVLKFVVINKSCPISLRRISLLTFQDSLVVERSHMGEFVFFPALSIFRRNSLKHFPARESLDVLGSSKRLSEIWKWIRIRILVTLFSYRREI